MSGWGDEGLQRPEKGRLERFFFSKPFSGVGVGAKNRVGKDERMATVGILLILIRPQASGSNTDHASLCRHAVLGTHHTLFSGAGEGWSIGRPAKSNGIFVPQKRAWQVIKKFVLKLVKGLRSIQPMPAKFWRRLERRVGFHFWLEKHWNEPIVKWRSCWGFRVQHTLFEMLVTSRSGGLWFRMRFSRPSESGRTRCKLLTASNRNLSILPIANQEQSTDLRI